MGVLGYFCWVLTTPTGGESQWLRGGEKEKVKEQARLGWLLHNVCCCCMTRLVTLRFTTPQSTTKRRVCGVSMRDRGRWCWEGGPQACPWVIEGIVIDCTAVTFNYVSIQSMQKVAGAKVTFLHSDYSCLLCGSAVLCLPAWAHGLIHFVDAHSLFWGCTMAQET